MNWLKRLFSNDLEVGGHMRCPSCGASVRFKLAPEPGNYTFCLECFRVFRYRFDGNWEFVADEAAPAGVVQGKKAAMRCKAV